MNKTILLNKTYFCLCETKDKYVLYLLIPILKGTSTIKFLDLNEVISPAPPASSWNVTCNISTKETHPKNINQSLELRRNAVSFPQPMKEEVINFARGRFDFLKEDIADKEEIIIHTVLEEDGFRAYESYAIPIPFEEDEDKELPTYSPSGSIAYNYPYIYLGASLFIDDEHWGAITLYPKVLLPLKKKYKVIEEEVVISNRYNTNGELYEEMKATIRLESLPATAENEIRTMYNPKNLIVNKSFLHDKGEINARIRINLQIDESGNGQIVSRSATTAVPDGVRSPSDDDTALNIFIDKW